MYVAPWILAAAFALAAATPAVVDRGPVDYRREVKPLLMTRCASCHGAVRQKAGLRLDAADLIRRGGKSGAAVEPGAADDSLVIERVTTADRSLRMPPESEGTPLSTEEVAILRAWIDQGARAPAEPTPPDPREHWAFRPPVRPAVPAAVWGDGAPCDNPIDAFLAASHRARGLRPAPELAPDLWLRRAWIDLVGVPPGRADLEAFRREHGPAASARAVDRLLADPRHGERWGRHWLDVWRYSDWYGLGAEIRYSHPHIWRWRDWVVESLNADAGYDRMVAAMLAGDELAPGDPSTLRATGYLARNWDIFNRNVWVASTAEHTARAFLGLTLQCARCHDHKYDPISQVEYYRLRAFFEPHHIRVDRVPGQPDREKDGLVRAFDDFLDRPTFRFIRGDETRPDASRPLTPATPAVLGGEVRIEPRSLSLEEAWPDKRAFVVREAEQAAEAAVAKAVADRVAAERRRADADGALRAAEEADRQALAALGAAKDAAVPAARDRATEAAVALARARSVARDAAEDRAVASQAVDAAEAKREALRAVLAVERMEDAGGKARTPDVWADLARAAGAAQRRSALAAARHDQAAARRDVDRATRTLDLLSLPAAAALKGDPLKGDRTRAAADLGAARLRLTAAETAVAKADLAAKAPADTTYAPRPLEFPRAKTTYRDTPPTTPFARTTTGRRLALARWIVDGKNPLTARVAVNHLWARHFGEPLVDSVDDFGLRAPRPELHELLDWLAVELVESGWSLKHLHRLIVGSRAYRMHSSAPREAASNAAVDPDNRLFWRMNARRMEGEVVRDSLLSLAGVLDPRRGGPERPIAEAEAGNRRSIYYRHASGEAVPLLSVFDGASVVECYRRRETVVPQQALALSNSGLVLTRAGQIAARLSREVSRGVPDGSYRPAFVDAAYESLLGRRPTTAERDECLAGLDRLVGAIPAGKDGTPVPAEVQARAALVHVLINHNDFVTVR